MNGYRLDAVVRLSQLLGQLDIGIKVDRRECYFVMKNTIRNMVVEDAR